MIDSHVNLHHEAFGEDLNQVMARALEAGVDGMLTICDKTINIPAIAAISDAPAQAWPRIWYSVGAHPHYASEHLELTCADLIELAKPEKVIGIGETGLDFHYTYSSLEDQVTVFKAHIDAARATGLPLIVHTREADDLMASILEEETAKGAFPILLHCYTSGMDLLHRGLALGAYVAFSGIATFKNAAAVREAALAVPRNRVLIETDCPYLAPIPMRGRRNEPAFVPHVSAFLAGLYGMDAGEFASQADANFFALFQRAS
jgi:TatD DNase family protein